MVRAICNENVNYCELKDFMQDPDRNPKKAFKLLYIELVYSSELAKVWGEKGMLLNCFPKRFQTEHKLYFPNPQAACFSCRSLFSNSPDKVKGDLDCALL